MPRTRPLRRGLTVAVVGLGLLASACGSEGNAPDTAEANAAGEAAAQNIDDLQQSDNVLDIEVLDVASGSASTLRDAVDGDRPVLLWFYAPH
ncbi:MAG: hypothetical protein AAGA90_08345 [Actinomycetota bacterium]